MNNGDGGRSAAPVKEPKGDCGCGCGGSGGCGTDVTVAGAGFVRPQFFGGMLLTEDDLQAVVDYTVAKRKLTNRYVFGAGVVCGLEVTPDPCDPRVVVVSPGYAIECCGNDILVSCPERVDIIELVRELRQRTGVDCGEPCDEQPNQQYHLYVRYAETMTAPVAPYAPDDCMTGDCEFSRISEGYRFELRCDEPEDVETLIDKLGACRPPDDQIKARANDAVRTLELVERRQAVMASVAEGEEPVVKAPSVAAFNKVAEKPEEPEGEVKFEPAVELVGRTVAARAMASVEAPAGGQPRRAVPRAVLNRAKAVAERLRASEELKARPPEERARIERILTVAIEEPDLSGMTAVDRAWLREGTSADDADREFVVKAGTVRDTVLRQLAERGETGSEEYRAISQMQIRSLSATSPSSVSLLAQAFLRLARGCTCSAFNPPCPTCTDDAVVLARIRVDACEVVDVCELERRWVLSPRALSYWFPVVDSLREVLEHYCCARDRKPVPTGEPGRVVDDSPYAIAQSTGSMLVQNLKETSGDRESQQRIVELERKLDAVTLQLDAMSVEKGAPR